MRSSFIAIAILILFLVSCKKEKSFDPNNPNGGGSSTTLLTKAVTHIEDDSITALYTYDAQKRLSLVQYQGEFDGDPINEQQKFVRNAQGVIQKVIYKSLDLLALGVDSLIYVMGYNSGNSRYTFKLLTLSDGGTTVKDSVSYTYNGAGKMIQEEEFLNDGGGYVKNSKFEYTYDAGGNIVKEKVSYFDDVNNMYVGYEQDEYQYDNKVNPLIAGIEAFLLGDATLVSTHNATKDTYTDLQDASNNDVGNTVYTYNTSNKPKTGILTYQSDGIPYLTNYYYQ